MSTVGGGNLRWFLVPFILAAVGFRIWVWRRRRAHVGTVDTELQHLPNSPTADTGPYKAPVIRHQRFKGAVAQVIGREVRERVRGRTFRFGSVFLIAAVACGVVIPTLIKSSPTTIRVGVLPGAPSSESHVIDLIAHRVGQPIRIVTEISTQTGRADVNASRLAVLVGPGHVVVKKAFSAGDTTNEASFVRDLALELGTIDAYRRAHLSPSQSNALATSKPFVVISLQPAHHNTFLAISLIGVILTFVMLGQYLTWTLTGVMEEKSSRVVEVLLSALRPLQLLTGKVVGIGLVAMGQASLVVAVALISAEAVGSSVLHGAGPVVIGSSLLWLVLGYAFYSWVYAAAGSTIERQDQVQSLALPLSLPMILGYVMGLSSAGSSSPSLFLKVLAYLPPTAPFDMPILVGSNHVAPWEFGISVLLSVGATFAVAHFAAGIYRRAILRTGARVRGRDLMARIGH